jgi:predicted lipid-binding transport protein (Tim44 family)
MSENFGYIDIILLAMIAGFILLRLRNTLGKGAENTHFKPAFQQADREGFHDSNAPADEEKNKDEFNESNFKQGAEAAYEMIINAFSQGDKKTLKSLVNQELYKNFTDIIDERKSKKLESSLTFIGIKSFSILDKKIDGNIYNVTTKFVSEILSSLKNEQGEVIEGDATQSKIVTDIWTFQKDIKSKDPTWYLIKLSSEEETRH